jgi:hypothetical protein
MPKIHKAGHKFYTHTACPVPAGLIKAVEIEAKLALPTNVVIKFKEDDEQVGHNANSRQQTSEILKVSDVFFYVPLPFNKLFDVDHSFGIMPLVMNITLLS